MDTAAYIDLRRRLKKLDQKLDIIITALSTIQETESQSQIFLATIQDKEIQTMADLSQIQAAVAQETTVTQSAITLLTQLADMIRANATDPAALLALADQITSDTAALSQAVSDNTPLAGPGI